jgi:hypothetical protein
MLEPLSSRDHLIRCCPPPAVSRRPAKRAASRALPTQRFTGLHFPASMESTSYGNGAIVTKVRVYRVRINKRNNRLCSSKVHQSTRFVRLKCSALWLPGSGVPKGLLRSRRRCCWYPLMIDESQEAGPHPD